jgi:DNA-binding CsgD family transcriptional regulator
VTSAPLANDHLATLGVLGFSAAQEELYRLLLRNSGTSVPDLAALAGLTCDDLREQVALLAGAGVVDVLDDVVTARPPAEAIARLVSEEARRVQLRTDQLEAVRGLLPALSAEHVSAAAPSHEGVVAERVHGGDVLQLLRSIAASSAGDLLWLRPDQWKLSTAHGVDDWVREMVASGRRSRAIYPARVLEESPETIRRRAEAGEHVRILAEVPCRLAITGTAAALMSEDFGLPTERRLVIRQPALVEALTLMFEGLWEKAMSVPGLDAQPDAEGVSDQRLLLLQLAGGAKDEQIARTLGMSVRTVRRRVADLMDELGADSRFQAGVEAVRRGWI